jgi:hypothetical protein
MCLQTRVDTGMSSIAQVRTICKLSTNVWQKMTQARGEGNEDYW